MVVLLAKKNEATIDFKDATQLLKKLMNLIKANVI